MLRLDFQSQEQLQPLIFSASVEDKAKVRQAIKNKTVHAVVARSTASTSNSSQAVEKKRKASFIEPPSISTSTATSRAVADTPRVPNAIYPPTASQVIEVAEEADAEEPEEDEPPERLYTILNTSIVGVQYYQGYMRRLSDCLSRPNALGRSRRVWGTGEACSGTKQSIR